MRRPPPAAQARDFEKAEAALFKASHDKTRAEIEQHFAGPGPAPGTPDRDWFDAAHLAIHSGDPADRIELRNHVIEWLNDAGIPDNLNLYLFYVLMFVNDLPHAHEGKKPIQRYARLVRTMMLADFIARYRKDYPKASRTTQLEAAAAEMCLSVSTLQRLYDSPGFKTALGLFQAGADISAVKHKLSGPST